MIKERERLIGLGEMLGHASWFERKGGEAWMWGMGWGMWLQGWGKSWGWSGY